MQTAYFPMRHLRITQAYGVKTSTHKYGYPIDNAGQDTGINGAWAPFDGVIRKIYKNGNSVWLESLNKVKYADGTVDYMTVMFTHDNYVGDLRVGQRVKQWQTFYQEGTNNASGNHVHIEISRGKFTGTGWYQAKNGQWVTNKPYRPEKAFLLKGVTILNAGGLNWTVYQNPIVKVIQKITPKRKDTLKAGEKLRGNQSLWSQNGKFEARFQKDSNFVIYKYSGKTKKAIWASDTWKKRGTFLTMQPDGNLVIYIKWHQPIWASNTYKKGGVRLTMQNDGNLVIYTAKKKPVWATGTNGK